MNVNKVLTRDYEQMDTWSIGKNEPKTNPNEPKLKKTEMNVTKVLTKDYEKKLNWPLYENEPKTKPNKPNSNPIQTQFKANTKPIQTQFKAKQTQFYRGVASGEAGTNPIQTQFQRANYKQMTNQSLTELFADSLLLRVPKRHFKCRFHSTVASSGMKTHLKCLQPQDYKAVTVTLTHPQLLANQKNLFFSRNYQCKI